MSSSTSKPAVGLTRFWWGKCEGKDWQYLDVDGRIILEWVFKKIWWGRGIVDWVDLTEDRDKWRALVNTLMSLRVP